MSGETELEIEGQNSHLWCGERRGKAHFVRGGGGGSVASSLEQGPRRMDHHSYPSLAPCLGRALYHLPKFNILSPG